ncbi:DNA-binding protein [Streptomyces sparsogenes]|uniref:DNA-binding protein n=1 Tax=Streptomyces sparsogenes TaxID=67365 RepID=UPI0033CD0750
MSDPKIYYLPVKPADPHADILTIQETAYVMRISVTKLRRIFRDDKDCRLHSRHGRPIVTSREHRQRISRLLHTGAKTYRRKRPSASRRPAKSAA